jgi:hypothetical protein
MRKAWSNPGFSYFDGMDTVSRMNRPIGRRLYSAPAKRVYKPRWRTGWQRVTRLPLQISVDNSITM